MPATIRSLDKYTPTNNTLLGLDAYKPLTEKWGLQAGFHYQNKGMKTDAKVKGYSMEMRRGDETLSGLFTGNVVTEVDEWMVTLPLQVAYNVSPNVIIADNAVMPTSELPSHLSVHARLIEKGSNYKATVHTHPIELIAMSHNKKFMGKDVLSNLLWSMIPETKAFCPLGLGIVPYQLPGSLKLAEETLKELEDYDVVMWEKHGVFAKGLDVMDAFDQIDVLSKSAKIYIDSKCMGFEPDGMSQEEMAEMTKAFNLPR